MGKVNSVMMFIKNKQITKIQGEKVLGVIVQK